MQDSDEALTNKGEALLARIQENGREIRILVAEKARNTERMRAASGRPGKVLKISRRGHRVDERLQRLESEYNKLVLEAAPLLRRADEIQGQIN